MTIGMAVKERILQLCKDRDWSNKLCTMSGVTQSTVNSIVSGRNESAMISTIQMKISFLPSYSGTWSKRFDNEL